MRKITLSQQQLQDIDYQHNTIGKSLTSIGKEYGIDRHIIARELKANGYSYRESGNRYTTNHSIFKTIDSSEKAYWLGFLAADGCNFRRRDGSNATIAFSLKEDDIEQVQKFANFMGSNNPIQYLEPVGFGNTKRVVRASINSIEISNDLVKLGIVPRKSLILQPPNIDSNFYLPYICGYFDGDGSIYKANGNIWCFSFVGTKELLSWISNLSGYNFNLEQKKSSIGKNTYSIRCGGSHKPYAFLKAMYDSVDNSICLQRKLQRFKEFETVVFARNGKDYQPVNCWEPLRALCATT